jgi:hypothetical protein
MLGFIKSPRDMPRWGQLGCSGFIVVDAQKRIVAKATAAYLQVKELAFGHLEVLLDALLAGAAAPSVYPGQLVALDRNKGVVLDTVDQVDGKCSVFLLHASNGGSMVRVSPENLRFLPSEIQLSSQQLLRVQQAHKIAAAAAKERQKGRAGVPLLREPSEEGEQDRKRKAKSEADAAANAANERNKVDEIKVASVLNADLDRQHEECAAALDVLTKERTASALEVALGAMQRHFEYEERLLDTHLYADLVPADRMGGGFNADMNMRNSHYADHARIISAMEDHLFELRQEKQASTCTKDGGCVLPGGKRLALSSIMSIVSDFETHANR